MANDVKQTISMPDLDIDGKQAQLLLHTYKDDSGKIISATSVHFLENGMIRFEICGDFRKVLRREVGRGTQKVLDAQHLDVFKTETIAVLKAEVADFYARKYPKTRKQWSISHSNLGEFLKVGDYVADCIMDYMLNVLPPVRSAGNLLQMGEPYDHIDGRATYHTIYRVAGAPWQYRGCCFASEHNQPSL